MPTLKSKLTKVELKSEGKPRIEKFKPSPFWNDVFGLAGDKTIVSKTFAFAPDPYVLTGVAGDKFYSLAGMKFTILTDGTTTQYTSTWTDQSSGWSTVNTSVPKPPPGPDLKYVVTNSAGGVIDTWDLGNHHFLCKPQNPILYKQPQAQNVYDIAVTILFYIDPNTTFYKNC